MASQIDNTMEDDTFYIQLSKIPVRFEPVSKVTNVFFDDSNRQVFAVRSGGAAGVVVKGQDESMNINFRMEERGDVISIKFSYDMKILAVQRSHKSVEFLNFSEGMDFTEYSQSCKGKNTRIIGFNWTNINEIVFVTDHGMEYYQVLPEKKSLKLLKSYGVHVNWFVWLPESAVLLLSTGILGNLIHPFHFRESNMIKLPKFEVDLPVTPKPPKLSLLERDVTMANMYGQLYVVVLRHQPRSPSGPMGAEIVLYQIQRDSPAKKTDVLRLDMSGRFAINIVDNLIVVHHQASKTSIVFDINLGGECEGGLTYHQHVLSPQPIRPFKLVLPTVPTSSGAEVQDYSCELYSPNWIVFQPNIVIDAKLGCLWAVQLRLDPLLKLIPDKCRLIDFLLLRKESKMVILTVCKQMLTPGQQANLTIIATAFNKLNRVYWGYLDAEVQAMAGESYNPDNSLRRKTPVIDQSDMYTHVFSVFADNKDIAYKFMVAVLVEYVRSLSHFQIPVQHYLYELIINTLVQHNCFYQLHQFLQYHVLSDSKPLACLLLSLEGQYPPAHQLALDMLKRLSTANEEIIEVLLSKQQLLPALRFIRSVGAIDQVSARKFLDTAKLTEDKMLFFTVFKFFEQRNIRLRSNPKFAAGEHCDQYVKHFDVLFGSESTVPANSQ